MKNLNVTLVISVLILQGCVNSSPIVATGEPNEYTVITSSDRSVFSSLDEAIKSNEVAAKDYCTRMGMNYEKKYSVDKPQTIMAAPNSTLFFKCLPNG